MKTNMTDFANTLNTIAVAAKALAPFGNFIGLPNLVNKMSSVVATAAEVAENTIKRVEEGKIVLESHDENMIRDTLENIRAINDELDKFIDAN